MTAATLEERALARLDRGVAARIAEAAPWPELEPLQDIAPAEPAPFPFDGLGSVLGPAARVIADAVQAPDSLAGGSVLAAAALAAQPHADVLMPHGQCSPLSLFIPTSADSGARKSVVDSVACAPIEEQRRQDARDYADKLAAYKADKATRKSGDGTDEAPAARAIAVSKATTEGLHHLLRNQSHIGLFSPEGAEVFGGHSMQAEKKSAAIAWLLKAWGGETLDSMTRGDGLSVLAGRRLTMHVLMQPVILRQLLADPLAQGQGWIARSLIAEPRSLAGGRLFRDEQVPAQDRPEVVRFHNVIRRLLAMPPQVHPAGDGHELQPRALPLSPGARALWVEFYNEVERQQAAGGPLAGVRAWASKAAEHAARIAGVVTLATDPDAADVPAGTMEGAVELAAFYLSEHVRLMGQSQDSQQLQRLHLLLKWMQDRGRQVAHADVLQRSPRPLRELKAAGINSLLAELSRRGYVRRTGDDWEVRRA